MRPVRIKHAMEKLVSHGGLILIGELLNSMQTKKAFNHINVHCVEPKFSHADILFTMAGLISISKSDYDAIKIFREKQECFTKALQISGCSPCPTIRQRTDLISNKADDIIKQESVALVQSKSSVISPIQTTAGKFIPLDQSESAPRVVNAMGGSIASKRTGSYPTQGKTVWIGKTKIGINGEPLSFPIVFEVTELYIKNGQRLIFPEI